MYVMNQGAFARNCELLLIHLDNLQKRGKIKKCRATTKYLAKAINKSPTQTNRYLRSLEARGLIKRDTSRFFRNKVTRRPYKLRTIKVFCAKPENSDQVLAIYFDKKLHGRTKNSMIRNLVKSNDFKYFNVLNSQESLENRNVLQLNLSLAMANVSSKQIIMKQYDEFEDMVKRNEFKLEEKRFNTELDKKAEAIFNQMWDGTTKIPDHANKTPMSRLAYLSCKQFQDVELLMFKLDPPTPEQKLEKVRVWIGNTIIKKAHPEAPEELWIRIYLGGEIPYEVSFPEYFGNEVWGEYFKLFKEEYKKINEQQLS
jgi:DNA-binding Lrp family transcriptional regulator